MESQVNNEDVQVTAPELPKPEPRVPKAAIPNTKVKVVDEKDYKAKELEVQISMVKTYSTRMIKAQLNSKRINEGFRLALENELKERGN